MLAKDPGRSDVLRELRHQQQACQQPAFFHTYRVSHAFEVALSSFMFEVNCVEGTLVAFLDLVAPHAKNPPRLHPS